MVLLQKTEPSLLFVLPEYQCMYEQTGHGICSCHDYRPDIVLENAISCLGLPEIC
jgi:hypothetical protein